MKDNILRILAFIWTKIVPILLMMAFSVGILFNLWKVCNLPFTLALIITIVGGGLIGFGLGKLIKLW